MVKVMRLAWHVVSFAMRFKIIKLMTPLLFTALFTSLIFLLLTTSLLPEKHALHVDRHRESHLVPQKELFIEKSSLQNISLTTRITSTLSATEGGRYYLTIIPRGRLGNQMFEYASLLGIADVNKRIPFVSSSCKVTHYFANASVSDRKVSDWRTMEELNYAEKEDAFDALPESNIMLKGFFQSWKYFAGIADKVKKSFRFLSDIQEAVDAFYAAHLQNLTGDDFIKIGVHVRRTDMLHKMEQKQGYGSAPLSYLRKAISHMRSRFGNRSIFFVVSDDPDWCLQHLQENAVYVLDSAPSVVHLGFLAMCDHVIMTVGTFGWWGAYLSGGHVVYYNGYPKANSDVSQGFIKEDFYLPHWTPLGD